MRHRLAAVVPAAAALLVAFATGSPTAMASDTTPGLEYVNLGDSFSAGSGVLPLAPGSNPICWQSGANFAHVVAGIKGYDLTDASCGAAQTKDFTTSQYPGVAPQLDALSSSTRLVTMIIGGNDNNLFSGVIAKCLAAGMSTLGQGSPCKDRYGDTFANTISTSTYANLVGAISAVKAKAPNARVAISGVPWVMPPTGGCFQKMPIAVGDVPYVRDIESVLNATFAKAAATTGITYVDQEAVSEGHDACQPASVRWIEPALFSNQLVPIHPNAAGERGMAQQVIATLEKGRSGS